MPDPVFLSGDAVPDYLRGVELMSTGLKWRASTGPVTITAEHLADAVIACNDDPLISPPRIRLGHTSPLNGDAPQHDPFAAIGDAEPAFGTFSNLRLENDGAVLVGDVDRILTWLGLSAPAAYPNRSGEAVWEISGADFDVQTPGGRKYQMVVTAIAFLGIALPAVQDLEDLSALITSGPTALAAARGDERSVQAELMAAASDLSVSTETVYWRLVEQLEKGEFDGHDTYMWWPREIRLEGDGTVYLVVDRNDGHTTRIDVDTDGKDRIDYAIVGEVRDEMVPVAASRLVASFARPSKPSPKPAAAAAPVNAATERPEPNEVTNMGDDVRAFLVAQGFDPETATDDQINAAQVFAAAATLNPQTPAATTEPEAPEGDEPTAEVEVEVDEPAPERVPVAASADPITAAKDAAFAKLSAEVAELRAERESSNVAAATKRRDEQVSVALSTGRITPAERVHYRNLLDIDEDRAGALLSALPADRVPLTARAQVPDPEADGLPAGEPLPDNVSLLNSSERAALAARRAA